jgi:hypothetical protein
LTSWVDGQQTNDRFGNPCSASILIQSTRVDFVQGWPALVICGSPTDIWLADDIMAKPRHISATPCLTYVNSLTCLVKLILHLSCQLGSKKSDAPPFHPLIALLHTLRQHTLCHPIAIPKKSTMIHPRNQPFIIRSGSWKRRESLIRTVNYSGVSGYPKELVDGFWKGVKTGSCIIMNIGKKPEVESQSFHRRMLKKWKPCYTTKALKLVRCLRSLFQMLLVWTLKSANPRFIVLFIKRIGGNVLHAHGAGRPHRTQERVTSCQRILEVPAKARGLGRHPLQR